MSTPRCNGRSDLLYPFARTNMNSTYKLLLHVVTTKPRHTQENFNGTPK